MFASINMAAYAGKTDTEQAPAVTDGFTVGAMQSSDTEAEKISAADSAAQFMSGDSTPETSGECGAEGSDVTWDLTNGTLTISGTGAIKDCSRPSMMPKRPGGAPWYTSKNEITTVIVEDGITDLGICAFGDCANLTSVTIPDSVTNLGEKTFYACAGLTDIDISENITAIGESVLQDCTSLKNVTLPDNLSSITMGMFSGCTNLTDIDIPQSVTIIGQSAFYGCTELNNIIIPENVTEIYMNAFAGCTSFTDITVPDGVTGIGEGAFSDCINLTNIKLPEELTDLYSSVFRNCASLTAVKLPKNIKEIGRNMFSGCVQLTDVNIPDNVNAIGYGAFSGCVGLTGLSLPKSLTYIDEMCFNGCDNLASVEYAGSKSAWRLVEGRENVPNNINIKFKGFGKPVPPAASGKCGENMTWSFDGITLTINGSGKMTDFDALDIPWKSFQPEIREIIISDDVTEVSDGAFRDCDSLVSVKLPKSLTKISDYMFYNDTPRSVVIPDGVKTIGNNVFGYMGSANRIEVPDSVTSIGEDGLSNAIIYYTGSESQWAAIDGSDAVSEYHIHCDSHLPVETSGEEGYRDDFMAWTLDDNGTLTVNGTGSLGGSASAIELPWYPFADKIKKVIIGEGFTSTGFGAFEGCINLKEVQIPSSITSLELGSFSGCCRLESVVIHDTVTRIAIGVFSGCTSLKKVTLPKNQTRYIESTFKNCKSLENVIIPSGTTSVCANMFYNCSGLESITIPDTVTRIGDNAFYNCTSLKNITLPDTVTTLGDAAFIGCLSMKAIEIPQSVTKMGANTFNAYDAIADIYYPGDETEWQAIEGSENVPSTITIHYNSHIPAAATSGECGENLTWSVKDGVLKIEGEGAMIDFESAGKTPWYRVNDQIKSIQIADGVTSIGKNSFAECANLTSVTVPGTVTGIDTDAFDESYNVSEIYYSGSYDDWNSLSGEVSFPEDTEFYYEIPVTESDITMTDTGTSLTFTASITASYENSRLFAAVYDADNHLISVGAAEVSAQGETSVSLDKPANAKTAKAFILHNNIQPITTAKEFEL